MKSKLALRILPAFGLLTATLFAQEAVTEKKAAETALAMKLSNPVSNLISVPVQNNFDFGAGPSGDGFQYKIDVRPVIPFGISEDWNLISRTILPYIYQDDVIGTSSQSGLSDTIQSFFFSPKEPTDDGWIWSRCETRCSQFPEPWTGRCLAGPY